MNSSQDHHTTLATAVAVLKQTIQSYGLDFDAISLKAGIQPSDVYDPGNRIPVTKIQKIWKIAAEETQDDAFGLAYASYFQPAVLHGLGLAWLTSSTLKDSLNRLVRYQRVLSTVTRFSLEENKNSYCIVLDHEQLDRDLEDITADAVICSFYKMCKISMGPLIVPKSVSMKRPQPSCQDRLNAFFGIEIAFNSARNCIVFDRQFMETIQPAANANLARMNDQIVIDYLKKLNKEDIEIQVQSTLIEQLPSGVPSQKETASALNMSIRNLQRRLHEKGSSFKKLLNRTREELAVNYLKESEKPIIEIGFLLGYVDASNFARAFRRWQGVSPQQYRRDQHQKVCGIN
ncbi:AraC family transcriptional regulator [Alkalimarinus alittae]|uniref:AraC family transcriptional regulator n=1 Tax=Alkalimarinus alittae TaxID=2961619 RepID=A0ABY6N087_9ALTE|nr:AraC family transcriptional regulator [Alkalimarinus alittae]UZE95510.1 AraC family transcriptional regulator [Alkalimarinus alittae]